VSKYCRCEASRTDPASWGTHLRALRRRLARARERLEVEPVGRGIVPTHQDDFGCRARACSKSTAYPPARLTNQEAIGPVAQARAQQVANGDRRQVALRTTDFESQLTGRVPRSVGPCLRSGSAGPRRAEKRQGIENGRLPRLPIPLLIKMLSRVAIACCTVSRSPGLSIPIRARSPAMNSGLGNFRIVSDVSASMFCRAVANRQDHRARGRGGRHAELIAVIDGRGDVAFTAR
jgi:hypothetical protein